VKQVLRALQPGLEDFSLENMFPEITARAAAERGLGVLDDREEVAAALIPQGPVLPADRLHPWVWEPARPLWETSHYRQAIQTAWTTVNAKIQDKSEA